MNSQTQSGKNPLQPLPRYNGRIHRIVRAAYLIRLIRAIDEESLDQINILLLSDPIGIRSFLRDIDPDASESEIQEEIENLHNEYSTNTEYVQFPMAVEVGLGRGFNEIDLGYGRVWDFIGEAVREDRVLRRMAGRENEGWYVDSAGIDGGGEGFSDYSGSEDDSGDDSEEEAYEDCDVEITPEDEEEHGDSDVEMTDVDW